jgi:hypothetical protein
MKTYTIQFEDESGYLITKIVTKAQLILIMQIINVTIIK